MPHYDRISGPVTGPWRKVLRYLQGGQSGERIADAVTSALAATLRRMEWEGFQEPSATGRRAA
jgi:hypothetical protein